MLGVWRHRNPHKFGRSFPLKEKIGVRDITDFIFLINPTVEGTAWTYN